MKFILVALAATLAAAAPEATPWCMRPGQSCWKVKRAAEAFADAIHATDLEARSPEAEASVISVSGEASRAARRSVVELANLIALAEAEPYLFYEGLDLDTKFPTPPDAPADDKVKREATPEAVEEDKRWCMRPGQSCWKAKRAAEAVVEAIEQDKRWCMRPGQSCWKRDAEPEAEAEGEEKRWCMRPGQSCWKREEDKRWCMRPGQSCWKAKRDLHAMHAAARDVIQSLE
ncbi:hypothetical protein B0I35DRAFT_411302 [Stachybotrys elegans]|uniref:Clock-controlled pheromone ccg-4 n=1 Tax=Stachybotrys elegans TaxID=80388 RepID=A0A8K0SNK6_9HYPO|nr:hypothetical protein B0I35DRAFT_411302 [Stachybotrys elegans]